MLLSLQPRHWISARPLLAIVLVLAALICSPRLVAAEDNTSGVSTLADLIRGIDTGNQELLSSEFRAQQYNSRISLALDLDDPLLAYYYLGFPARILRDERSPAPAEGAPSSARPTRETVRGQTLFERSSFMIKAMSENRAAWYRAVNDDLRLQIIRKIREDFYQLYFQDQIIKVNEKTLELIDHLLDSSRERYAVGKLAQQDVLQVQNEKTLLLARLLELRQKRLTLAADLNYLAGRDPSAPLLPSPAGEMNHQTLKPLSFSAGDLTAYMKKNRPLLQGYRSLVETFGIMRLMIPMYYNMALRRDGLLEVESGQRATRAEMTDFERKVAAELVSNYGEVEKNLELARLYGTVLLPQARQLVSASQADFEVGRSDLRAPLQAMMNLNRFQNEYFQSLANYQVSLARLEAASARAIE